MVEDDIPDVELEFVCRVFEVEEILVSATVYASGEHGVRVDVTPRGFERDSQPVGIVLPDGMPLVLQMSAEMGRGLRKLLEDVEWMDGGEP